jgi:hypothetical protein
MPLDATAGASDTETAARVSANAQSAFVATEEPGSEAETRSRCQSIEPGAERRRFEAHDGVMIHRREEEHTQTHRPVERGDEEADDPDTVVASATLSLPRAVLATNSVRRMQRTSLNIRRGSSS